MAGEIMACWQGEGRYSQYKGGKYGCKEDLDARW